MKTYFGLEIYKDYYVLESDIKQLAFYEFWKDSSNGSTCLALNNDKGIYITDWSVFCKQFIKYGTHRYHNALLPKADDERELLEEEQLEEISKQLKYSLSILTKEKDKEYIIKKIAEVDFLIIDLLRYRFLN